MSKVRRVNVGGEAKFNERQSIVKNKTGLELPIVFRVIHGASSFFCNFAIFSYRKRSFYRVILL